MNWLYMEKTNIGFEELWAIHKHDSKSLNEQANEMQVVIKDCSGKGAHKNAVEGYETCYRPSGKAQGLSETRQTQMV